MSQMLQAKAQRARENCAYLRELLWRRQPEFAAALASADQYLSHLLTQAGNEAGPVAHEIGHLDGSIAVGGYRAQLGEDEDPPYCTATGRNHG